MMSKSVKTMDELTDSRLLYDKDPPAFGYILLGIVSILLIAAIYASSKVPKYYTIQAQGMVTNPNSNYVMCAYSGEINESTMFEGKFVEKGDVLFQIKNLEYMAQQEQLKVSKAAYEKKVKQYEQLIKSMKENHNYFDETKYQDRHYYVLYEKYRSEIEQYHFDASLYKSIGYNKKQIKKEKEKIEAKKKEVYYSAIDEAERAIEEATLQLELVNSQLANVYDEKNMYEVKATATGVLHLIGDYKDGMVVQTSTTIATIAPTNTDKMIQAYVSSADMARIHTGDAVQIEIDGLAQNIYGTVSGNVIQIDSNATIKESSQTTTSQVFKVLISLDSDYLVNKMGEKVQIANGMSGTARIQYDELTYWDYILTKVGIRTR